MKIEGTLVIEQIESEALRGNALNDPTRRSIPVYLPRGIEDGRRYPVIYWLHGFTGTSFTGVTYNPWVPSLPELMDRVVGAGAPPAILVMADGWTRYGGSQYLNSTATGRYEDFVVQEIVGLVDAKYPTRAAREHRGVNGKSSGGYGALVLAMRHADVFGAVASHSGDLYFEACYKVDFWKTLRLIQKEGGLPAFMQKFDAAPKKTSEMANAMTTVVAMGMAYSPNPQSPFGFDFPCDLETGELKEAVWRRWLEWDPVHMVERYADAMRSMRLVYFECGTKDQYNLLYGARILHRRLTNLGIRHEYQEFDDDHTAVNYRYVESLRRLCEALAQ